MASFINEYLSKSGIIEKLLLNKKKYNNAKESKSLLAIFEQYLFVWHDNGSCILTTELNCVEGKDFKVKTLSLTNPPVFDVESILFNQTGCLLALNGKNGVMIFEVPRRFGKFGTPGSEAENIIGRSWNIAETFFISSNRIGIVQSSWHPGSPSSTHLTVLSTDNYLRIYDVTDPQTPQQVIFLGGNVKNSFLTSESKINFSACFGENAISFDFGPSEDIQIPYLDKLKLVKKVETVTVWPIYILHSNGDIFVVKAPVKKDKYQSPSKVMGPLSMYPPSDDNYGYDACYVLCLHTTPPCIVLATSTGLIYHCLVLENSTQKDASKVDDWEYDSSLDSCDLSLYVFESVELPLTLSEEQDDVYSHPIRLYKDITLQSKYHCTHMSGLHSVAVPFLRTIEEHLESEKLEKLLTSEGKQTSIVEHILCTKPLAQMDSIPVLGIDVTITEASVSMICLLASWEFVSFPLVCSYFSSVPRLLSENVIDSKGGANYLSPSFEQHIGETMLRSICCPYLKSNPTSKQALSSPQQWLDLLYSVTQRFREDYIQKIHTGQALLKSRIKVLTQQKEYQLRDIARIQQEKGNLQSGAEGQAVRYEDINVKQQELMKKIENILQKLQQNQPHLSKAEISMKQTLLSYEDKLKEFENGVALIQKKLKLQNGKLKDASEQISNLKSDVNSLNLNEVQTKHIKELLANEGKSIAELVKNMNLVKKEITV